MTRFALGRFEGDRGPFTGVVVDGRVAAVSELLDGWADRGIEELLNDWDAHVRSLEARLSAGAELPWDEADLRRHAPLMPRQLLGAGMNYRTHVIDLMVDSGAGSRP